MTCAWPQAATGGPPQGAPPVFHGPPRRVVLDTNVLVAVYVFADPRFVPMREKLRCGEWQALADAACLAEYRRVLGYPQFGLSPERQEAAYVDYAALTLDVARPLDAIRPPLPRCADRDDQKFLELARDGNAEWLVTADKQLLRLARRDRLRGMFRILTPEAALAAD